MKDICIPTTLNHVNFFLDCLKLNMIKYFAQMVKTTAICSNGRIDEHFKIFKNLFLKFLFRQFSRKITNYNMKIDAHFIEILVLVYGN